MIFRIQGYWPKIKGIRDIFEIILRGTGYLDRF